MTSISITKFSCILSAQVSLGRVTVLIGPQASGKSIISKLVFFFEQLTTDLHNYAERQSFIDFSEEIAERFKRWFPPPTWGSKKFHIKFDAGSISLAIIRKSGGRNASQNVNFVASDDFRDHYEATRKLFDARRKTRSKIAHENERSELRDWELVFKVREESQKAFAKLTGPDYVGSQTFVPAGRSFFTSIGKLVMAFERGAALDEVTVQFGRLFIALRERRSVFASNRIPAGLRPIHQALSQNMFGGELKTERDEEYIQMKDGRRIPFALLSSGQQEALPLLIVLDYLAQVGTKDHLTFIEEPEAHLFPLAQSELIEYLVALVRAFEKSKIVITTHSPYVLSKLNNLLKAGAVAAENPSLQNKINSIIPRAFWLEPRSLDAYALDDGTSRRIIDGDGLIDGEYLDRISGDLGREYSSLLELEVNNHD
ncbi:MAG: hypothetical protein NVSMB26_17780 [Beijerinckiaceae bacterium]